MNPLNDLMQMSIMHARSLAFMEKEKAKEKAAKKRKKTKKPSAKK